MLHAARSAKLSLVLILPNLSAGGVFIPLLCGLHSIYPLLSSWNLIPAKTTIHPWRHPHASPCQDFVIYLDNSQISPSITAHNLGVTMGSQLSFLSHISKLICSGWFFLYSIRRICLFLFTNTQVVVFRCKTLLHQSSSARGSDRVWCSGVMSALR